MGEAIEESDDTIPGKCCVCGREDDGDEGTVWEVVEEDEPLREKDWYLHLFDVAEMKNGRLVGLDVYLFCPDCKPETPLPTADDRPDFDMDEFVDRWREEVGVDSSD